MSSRQSLEAWSGICRCCAGRSIAPRKCPFFALWGPLAPPTSNARGGDWWILDWGDPPFPMVPHLRAWLENLKLASWLSSKSQVVWNPNSRIPFYQGPGVPTQGGVSGQVCRPPPALRRAANPISLGSSVAKLRHVKGRPNWGLRQRSRGQAAKWGGGL